MGKRKEKLNFLFTQGNKENSSGKYFLQTKMKELKPMIDKINHYTINTGDMRTTTPDEVSSNVYFRLSSIINQAANKEYVDVIDGTKIHLTVEGNVYACTLYSGSDESDLVPILFTCGCRDGEDLQYVWSSASTMYERLFGTKLKTTPMSPFIADMILPDAFTRLDVLTWSGDFCRCLGWILLEPKAIIN